MTALDGFFNTSGLGAELYKRACHVHLLKCLEEEDMKPFPCKSVNRVQPRNKTGKLKYFARAKLRRAAKWGWWSICCLSSFTLD